MTARAHILLVLLLAGCIMFVFVSPAFDLPYTTAPGSRPSAMRLLMLCTVLQAWGVGMMFAALNFIQAWQRRFMTLASADSLIDITCTRRC